MNWYDRASQHVHGAVYVSRQFTIWHKLVSMFILV